MPTLPLATVAELVNERVSVDQIAASQYVSTENLLPDFAGLNPAAKLPPVSSVTGFQPKDILISNIRPYLKKVWQSDMQGGASNDVLVVRARESVGDDYLATMLRSDRFIDYVMRGAKGVKMPRGEISMIREFPVPRPCAKEQQKIADCLSSLDACIGAETRKLDALKTHKQGLMQQLFPGQGQRLPRLRFPGFAGEWGTAKLGDKSTIVRGGSPRPIDSYLTCSADGLNWLKIGDVDKAAKYIERTQEKVIPAALSKTRQIHPGDLILSNSMSFGRPYISTIVSCIHDGWLAITKIEGKINVEFLYYTLGSEVSQTYFLSSAAGSGVKNLKADGIKQLPVAFPNHAEQKKIAACLSSLDTLIATQSRKIAALQQHKQGLMQGLFPAPAVEAA